MADRPEPLDLPAGPLTAHLQAAHHLLEVLAAQVRTVYGDPREVLTAHEHHMREVARYTVPTSGPDFPPRPTLATDEDGYPALPAGWASVVTGVDAETGAVEVLCGWTTQGRFCQYADTASIVEVCTQALQEAHNHG